MSARTMTRSTAASAVVAAALMASMSATAGTAGAQPMYFSPEQRMYTLAEVPQCGAGTVDVSVQSGYAPDEIRANFTTHLYSPAWFGLADYECYLTITAEWTNLDSGQRGSVAHQVASWRLRGPNVANPYIDIVTGEGPVNISFTTATPHAPSPAFTVPAR